MAHTSSLHRLYAWLGSSAAHMSTPSTEQEVQLTAFIPDLRSNHANAIYSKGRTFVQRVECVVFLVEHGEKGRTAMVETG